MSTSGRANVRIEGLDELLMKIDTNRPVYGAPLGRLMRETVDAAHTMAQERVPTETGKTAATLTKKLMAGPVPLWGVVSTDYVKGVVRVPFILEAGHHKSRLGKDVKLHHRSGPRQGQSTRKWLSGVLGIIRKKAEARLPEIEREIEALWNR